MDMAKTGEFIAALRRSSGLSQREVAEQLGVGDKAVSKWECGRGLPDIATLPALAELFGVTVDELLRGERILEARQADAGRIKSAAQATAYLENRGKQIGNLLYIALGCAAAGAILLFILLNATYDGYISCGVSLLFCAGGGILLAKSWQEIASVRRNGAAMGAGAASITNRVQSLLALYQKVLVCTVFLTVLNTSLLVTAMQNGGVLAALDRGHIVHYWLAVMGAGAGLLAFRAWMGKQDGFL